MNIKNQKPVLLDPNPILKFMIVCVYLMLSASSHSLDFQSDQHSVAFVPNFMLDKDCLSGVKAL